MTDKKLHELLEQLKEELRRTDSVSEGDQLLLQSLTDDIQRALGDAKSEGDEAEASLLDRVNDEVSRLEGTHPLLAEVLGRIVDQLAALGI